MTESELIASEPFTVEGRVFLFHIGPGITSYVPLTCYSCDARTGLTISGTVRGEYTCPQGHVLNTWRLPPPPLGFKRRGADIEIRVPDDGRLVGRQLDEGDGDDDYRDLPL
ncbi:hypothetical protein [Streptomyces acidiscabies]|uniref:hypothetical protein n=1 Tax=Streptomyces acidiscabies TaxID=42234 RepID=UPI000E69A639|nr:hypothetical protein [Streptomyces acidiscabies]MBP5942605.1 hypothetical protein [Streptomyces sp. LBUM 1476]